MNSKVQSLLFDKNIFTIESCISWLFHHRFKYNKIDIKQKYYRFRQYNPSLHHSYRTIKLSDGIKAIIEF
jgi:hypothetical protein